MTTTTTWKEFETVEVAADETRIFLRRFGSGPPVLLLHGFPQTHVMWREVAPLLARGFTVVCPDLRGYGRSDCPLPRRTTRPMPSAPWRTTWWR
jgi:haloacetate dehalogenase